MKAADAIFLTVVAIGGAFGIFLGGFNLGRNSVINDCQQLNGLRIDGAVYECTMVVRKARPTS